MSREFGVGNWELGSRFQGSGIMVRYGGQWKIKKGVSVRDHQERR